MEELKQFLAAIILVVLFMSAVMIPTVFIKRHYAQINCSQFSLQSNREVKFVNYSFWKWECLTPTKNEKWISVDSLRDVD